MVDHNTPVTEDELHVYVDGELPADRREAVETWLSSHPEDAARVAAWRAQAEAIRARYGAVIHEPVPDRLTLSRITREPALLGRGRGRGRGRGIRRRRRRRLDGARRVGRGAERGRRCSPPTRSRRTSFTSARCAIRSRSRRRRIICCRGCRGASARRCGRPISARSASSSWAGACCPASAGRRRCSCTKARTASASRSTARGSTAARTAFRYDANDSFGAVHWIEGSYGWVVSGPKDKDKLKAVASAAYDQLENRTPAPSQGAAGQLMSRRGS